MNENKKTRKEKKRLSRSALVLIVGIIIIAIPVIAFLTILGVAALQTGSPREGSRFENDLDPQITADTVSALESDLKSIGSIQNVEVILSQGQLRVFIDTDDSLNEEQVDAIVTSAYNKVNSLLPINTYFTATDTKKMYDLQINVYTTAEATAVGNSDSRQYKLLHKNSMEETYSIDDMAHPKDPVLAAELEGLTIPTTDETEEEGEGSGD
ncbi:MAG: hypothetical protein IKS69_07955 [Erysipelotrichaceae bacterium]|nr:hypothetical protein [Erysipelotrichaceae bacterium]